MLQRINPEYRAVLLCTAARSNGISNISNGVCSTSGGGASASWDTQFADPKRQEYHDRKMASKVSRPASQLQAMGIPAGHVLHEYDHCDGR